ncbi:hypothetical protein C2S53_011762, partial [Perilla frutescens var. hirtella]
MKRAGFRGDAFKKLLWKAANATTVAAFNRSMVEIEKIDKKCLEWLQTGKSATEWSKSHFSTFGKEKPVLTMLEWIREYMMSRLQKNRDKAERKWEGRKICGRIRMIVGKNMESSSDCVPIKSNEYNYEISSFDGTRYAVNLEAHTCDCRRWELSGIPCKHAISAICAQGYDPEDYVHKCYSVETYVAVYAHAISPMNGDELWQKTGYIPPLPPAFGKKKKGRPQKERRFDANEDPKKKKNNGNLQKMTKQKFKVTCQLCGEEGHNRAGCQWRKGSDVSELEEITQPDYPNLTQENESMEYINEFTYDRESEKTEYSCTIKRPTTIQGRQMLARKRAKATTFATKDSRDDVSQEMSTPYSISNSINATQSRQIGVHIRAPPSMSFHPHHFIGGPSSIVGASKGKEQESMKVFTQGGKKFVTLSSLRATSHKGRG